MKIKKKKTHTFIQQNPPPLKKNNFLFEEFLACKI